MKTAFVMATVLVVILTLAGGPALARRPAAGRTAARAAAVKKPRPVSAPKAPGKRPGGDKSNRNNDSDSGGAKATASLSGGADSDSDAAAPPTTTASTVGPGGKTLKTKTYTFGAMDVEGKLKTPQLLYFLDRVKLELDMSAPDKRSFIKELEKSADDSSL
jgi:hypothetical protein